MKYDKILFDLDNTLIDFDDAERTSLRICFEKFSIAYKEEYSQIYHDINDKLWKMLEKGLIERKVLIVKRFEELFEVLGVKNVSPKEFN